jgi:hypothetical protein
MVNPGHRFVFSSTTSLAINFKGTYVQTCIVSEPDQGPTLHLLDLDEKYQITYPDIVVTGLIFGPLTVSNNGTMTIHCSKTDMKLQLECNSKNHSVDGKITQNGQVIYTIDGSITGVIKAHDQRKHKSIILMDGPHIKFPKKQVRHSSEQDDHHSRSVWRSVSEAIQNEDFDTASREKNSIEEAERQKRNQSRSDDVKLMWFNENKSNPNYTVYEFNPAMLPRVPDTTSSSSQHNLHQHHSQNHMKHPHHASTS